MLTRLRSTAVHVRDAAVAWVRAIWSCDRTRLGRAAAFGNRVLRIIVASLRGLSVHLVGVHAAALTFYTVFSIVPLLVLVVWAVKAVGHIPDVAPELPNAHHLVSGNRMLTSALHKLFENVSHTAAVTGGAVSLGAFIYAVIRLFGYTERALDMIAASTRRPLKVSRLLGYLALLLLLPALAVLGGLVAAVASSTVGGRIKDLLGAFHYVKLAVIAGVGLSILTLAIAIFYSAAGRARIAFSSAGVGAAVAAVLLAIVLWAFGTFQIGMSRGNAVQFGATAGPVLLLWVYASWYVLLFGAEVAVAHGLDRILVHGVWTFSPDVAGREQAGLEIMLCLVRGTTPPTIDGMARELRLPPYVVRDLCLELVARGLICRSSAGRLSLAHDPAKTHVADVVEAIIHDPALDLARAETTARLDPGTQRALAAIARARAHAGRGPTLRELTASASAGG